MEEIEISLATRSWLPFGDALERLRFHPPSRFLAPSLPSRLSSVPVLYWFALGGDRSRAPMKRGRHKGLLLALGCRKRKR